MLDKRALRREIAAQKRALSPAQIEAASADLTAQLLAHPLFRAARSLYAYLSNNQEVRTLPLIRQARDAHFGTFVFRCPVTTQWAMDGGRIMWNYPKFISDMTFTSNGRYFE